MKHLLVPATAALALALPVYAQNQAETFPSPNEIVDAAPRSEWVSIAAEDLLVMTLAPDRDGTEREVVIQLMPPPFSQGWVSNIRTLARAKWYDGISVNRVQDNYVVQWGDPNHDNPEAEGEAKALPEGLNVMDEEDYSVKLPLSLTSTRDARKHGAIRSDQYAPFAFPYRGWAIAMDRPFAPAIQVVKDGEEPRPFPESLEDAWPVHCYGMVGVGRNFSPDTGSGAELYTVIGHAPRHLDRNIALAGRIISGMEHMSSLPRGSGVLGFYTKEEAELRTPILSIRVASDLPEADRPQFEYLSTESDAFAAYADARANRRDPFFIVPAGGADICNIPVPVREVAGAE